MLSYIYDGTFEGLLSAILEALARKEMPDQILTEVRLVPNLFLETRTIKTDNVKTERLLTIIMQRLPEAALKDLIYCFLAEEKDIEIDILCYLKMAIQSKVNIEHNLANCNVFRIRKISDRVIKELQRYWGIVRFRKLDDGLYYAPIEPDYNIVSLLGPHFTKRFSDQQWLIHDVKRNLAIYYQLGKCTPVTIPEADAGQARAVDQSSYLSPEEFLFQNLWRTYFKNIAITGRINPKLQKQHLSGRYWKYLVEKN